jgi:NAD(P)-dependent dehydrogenase (short-subunit alcohol dehydrogenase family)
MGGEAVYAITDVKLRGDLSNLVGWQLSDTASSTFWLTMLESHRFLFSTSCVSRIGGDDQRQPQGVLYEHRRGSAGFPQARFWTLRKRDLHSGIQITPTMAVYAATKNAVRTITEGLRQEAGDKLRVTGISPGFVSTNLAASMTDSEVRSQIMIR